MSSLLSAAESVPVKLLWKSKPQKQGNSYESGIIELTLRNESNLVLRDNILKLNFFGNVSAEVMEIPVNYISCGGEITFLLPYSATGTLNNLSLLESAQLQNDSCSYEVTLQGR